MQARALHNDAVMGQQFGGVLDSTTGPYGDLHGIAGSLCR
jgi:hypothetical protein